MTTRSPATVSASNVLSFPSFTNLEDILGALVARPLMAVQVSAGLNNDCLGEAEAQQAKLRVETLARTFLPDAHVLSLCVKGKGTRFGVFARPPAPGEEANRFTTNLLNLSLSTPFPFDNFGIFVSLGLLEAGARAQLSKIDEALKREGATANSIRVQFNNNKIVTRLEGEITKTTPDAPYTATVRDVFERFDVANEQIVFQSPSDPSDTLTVPKHRFRCDGEVTIDIQRGRFIAAAILTFLAGTLAAAFSGPAAIPFFLASAAAVAQNAALTSREPPKQGGAACAFVQMVQSPDVFLPRQPGEAPKKIAFSYNRVRERADGLEVLGNLSVQDRVPRLGRIRPGTVGAKPGEQSVMKRFSVGTFDLRGPLTHRWTAGTGVTLDSATAASPRATFSLAGIGPNDDVTRQVSVRVTDADGLQVSASSDISVTVIDPSELEV